MFIKNVMSITHVLETLNFEVLDNLLESKDPNKHYVRQTFRHIYSTYC